MGEGGKLYAVCLIEVDHGLAIQAMADSSRYVVIKVTQGGKTAHLGLDSPDSFGLNTTLHHQGNYHLETRMVYLSI